MTWGQSRWRGFTSTSLFLCVCMCSCVPAHTHCPRQPSISPSQCLFSSSTVAEPKNNMKYCVRNYVSKGHSNISQSPKMPSCPWNHVCVDVKGLQLSTVSYANLNNHFGKPVYSQLIYNRRLREVAEFCQ